MAQTESRTGPEPFRCLVAGGGVAALEAALAIRALDPGLVDVELLAPETHFWYRPLAVGEPFGITKTLRFELAELAEGIGAAFTLDALASVDPEAKVAQTEEGKEIDYDALLVACGARPEPAIPGALTFRGPADTEAFRRLLSDLGHRRGQFGRLRGADHGHLGLALYELALLTATYLERQGIRSVSLTFVTHEPAPLALFEEKRRSPWLASWPRRGSTVTGTDAASTRPGALELTPGPNLEVDRVVALPRLSVAHRRIAERPRRIHPNRRLRPSHGVEGVYAAGDITSFPVKQGGLATQQADAAARSIVSAAGSDIEPAPFAPVLQGLLLTGSAASYMRSELAGGHGETAVVAGDALWWPPAKIAGRYLGPFLAERSGIALAPPPELEAVRVELAL